MTPIIERAYQLARSGNCSDAQAIVRQLHREGYERVLRHLASPRLRRELTLLCHARRQD